MSLYTHAHSDDFLRPGALTSISLFSLFRGDRGVLESFGSCGVVPLTTVYWLFSVNNFVQTRQACDPNRDVIKLHEQRVPISFSLTSVPAIWHPQDALVISYDHAYSYDEFQ